MRVHDVAHGLAGDLANFAKDQACARWARVRVEDEDIVVIDDDDGVELSHVSVAHHHELIDAIGDDRFSDVAAGAAHVDELLLRV